MSGKAVLTKERIKRTAEKMFIEKGYVATTLRDITAKAGVTTGAFYKHYGSKEEILISIFNGRYRTRQTALYSPTRVHPLTEGYSRLRHFPGRREYVRTTAFEKWADCDG